MADRQHPLPAEKTGNYQLSPSVTAGQKLGFSEFEAIAERIKQPWIDSAFTTILTFIDQVAPPIETMSGAITFTFDFTDAKLGNGYLLRFIGDGNDINFPPQSTESTIETEVGVRKDLVVTYSGVSPQEILVKDLAGTATTPPVDTDPPTLTFVPANGGTDFAIDGSFQILSNEPLELTPSGAEITSGAVLEALIEVSLLVQGGTPVPFSAVIDINKTTITITPSSDLPGNTAIYYDLAPVQDAAGNATILQSATITTVSDLQIFADWDVVEDVNSVVTTVDGTTPDSPPPVNGNTVLNWTDQIGGFIMEQTTLALQSDYISGVTTYINTSGTSKFMEEQGGSTFFPTILAQNVGTVLFVSEVTTGNVPGALLGIGPVSGDFVTLGIDRRNSFETDSIYIDIRGGGTRDLISTPAGTAVGSIIGLITTNGSNYRMHINNNVYETVGVGANNLRASAGTDDGKWFSDILGSSVNTFMQGVSGLAVGVNHCRKLALSDKFLSESEANTWITSVNAIHSVF